MKLAEQTLATLHSLPKPTIITCKSGARASAVAFMYLASLANEQGKTKLVKDVLPTDGDVSKCSFKGKAALVDWVIGFLNAPGKTYGPIVTRKPVSVRQLFEKESSTFTYILSCPYTNEAIVIDPVDMTVDRDMSILEEMGVSPVFALNTHVHADHITGTGLMKQKNPNIKSVISTASTALADVHLDTSPEANPVVLASPEEEFSPLKVKEILGIPPNPKIQFGHYTIEARATPGHTAGCLTYVMDDRSVAFTGDALLIRGCGRTDFQGGSAETLYHSVHNQIFTLPLETVLLPAHDYKGRHSTTVGEEKKFNLRLTKSLDEFKEIMANLNLDYPKKIDASLPKNLKCGFD